VRDTLLARLYSHAMERQEIQTGDDTMANTDRQLPFQTFTRPTGAMLGAGLLVFLGIVFQLCELSYSRFSAGSFWLISVIGESIWNILEACLKAQVYDGALRFWPLLLVLAGCAILVTGRTPGRSGASVGGRRGGREHE
jgi:hypothetical protein